MYSIKFELELEHKILNHRSVLLVTSNTNLDHMKERSIYIYKQIM